MSMMVNGARRNILAILAVIAAVCVVGSVVILAAACSGSAEESTSSTGGSSTTGGGVSATTLATTEDGLHRLVVGGKTTEEYEAALPDLEKAAAANPTDLTALQDLAVAQYNTGRYEEAAATYLKMLQLKDDAVTHNNYGNVLRDWKKNDEAKAQYEKALSMDPSLVTAYINLTGILVKEGNLAEAKKLLDRGIAATSGEGQSQLKNYKDTLNSGTTTT
jgi:tetratricopeptide (TPR) repeat protein